VASKHRELVTVDEALGEAERLLLVEVDGESIRPGKAKPS
jgi:hypothetical protein